jgi:hypothetical protein
MGFENDAGPAYATAEKPRDWAPFLFIVVVFLCVSQSITAYLLHKSSRRPESLVAINRDDPFILERVDQFDLPRVIEQYDQVINAIDSYYQVNGTHPSDLSALVPQYLPRIPFVYIRNGEKLVYSPDAERPGRAPFTFYIYGHYPGLAFMHGWELRYYPVELDYCNEPNDRHYHPYRVNHRWIWISRSAL